MSQRSPRRAKAAWNKDQAEETAQIMAKFDALMSDINCLKIPDLSLNRLAQLGIPAREISSLINQTHQQEHFEGD